MWCDLNLICWAVHFSIGRISDGPKPLILDEDVDVAEERERIYESEKTNDILRIRDLSKVRRLAFQTMTHHGQWKKMPRLMVQSKVKTRKYIQHPPYFVLTLSWQTYTGTIIPAVDRICVGVSPGEVCVVKPIQFTPRRKQSGHFTVHSSCFILILCSALVSWGLMEQGRPQRLRCWLETLTSPLERPQSLVTG